MDSQGAGFAFDATMDFSNAFATMPQHQQSLLKPAEDNTSASFFFGDEGIDTTTGFSQSFDTMNPALLSTPQTSFDMQHSLAMDNTVGSASAWNGQLTPNSHHALNTFPPTPVQSFDSLYQPNFNTTLGKRPLQLDVQDFPHAKRHETADFTLFSPLPSTTTTSSWGLEAQSTPKSIEVGLSDEAADVCATWFNKYAVLPSDRHIDSLSQLTGESADAIRSWFGRLLKQGMGGSHGDSAYKSQTNLVQQEAFWNDHFSTGAAHTSPPQMLLPQPQEDTTSPEAPCSHENTTVVQPASTLRGSKKRCTPTDDRQLLARDPNKIYQCTRKCGKRYGRKCDWKRNEEEGYPCKSWVCSLCTSEGVENVKPCFRKYHFVQHFRNIHPDINAEEYEEASVVCSETEFPRKCGFCRHRFVSRQERIDHIADHFKHGKCMLDWKEEADDDSHDSDSADDDDDPPSGDGFDGSEPSNQPPRDPRGGAGSKYYGGGNGGSGSDAQAPHGGFFQFQLSQLNEGDSGSQLTSADQHIKPADALQSDQQQRPSFRSESEEKCSIDGSISDERSALLSKHVPTAGDYEDALAGDALARSVADQDSSATIDATWPGTQPDLLREGKSDSESFALEIPTSTNRTVLQISDDRHSQPLGVVQSTISPSKSALSTGVRTSQLLETKVTSSFKNKVTRLIAQQALQSILTTSQSFLSVRLLGAGGFSTVDEVVHRETNLRMSRKTLKNRNQNAIEEIQKEVNVLQKLRHPHVIRFLGAYSTGKKMSILLSPVADTTLALWLEQSSQEKLPGLTETVVKMFGCLASSVRYLHEQRPVVRHMDIKPQNILVVASDQELPHVVLCDFGISSSEDVLDGQSKPLTRHYTAPEVFEGFTRKQAADIWSLGCVFAEMASISFSQGNSAWLSFRKEFSGRTGKYYWQDVPGLQARLSEFLDHAPTSTEQTVVRTLKTMLSSEPAERPDATALTMVFTPAPCCLSWPNDKATFPGPQEEFGEVEMLIQEGSIDCCTQLCTHGGTTEKTDLDLSTANGWLKECSHSHDACRQQSLSDTTFLPTRLIDVRPDGQEGSYVRVVNSASLESTDDQIDYVALSHVWNQEDVTLSSGILQDMLTELPLQALPTAVTAAISTAQRLGYRYIWVDSLCILQDVEEDKRRECATMASVFRNAALTVVLDQMTTKSLEGKPGVPSSSDKLDQALALTPETRSGSVEDRSPASASLPAIDFTTPGFAWDTRAWALQERLLSRRFLYLGEQMYWECNSLKASETFPRGLSPLVWEKAHSKTSEGLQPRVSNRTTDAALSHTPDPDTLDKKPISVTPHHLRNCQWIKKEGDGIGDSMEAAQTTLKLGDAKASSSTLQDRTHDQRASSLRSTTPDDRHQTGIAAEHTYSSSAVEPARTRQKNMQQPRLKRHGQTRARNVLPRDNVDATRMHNTANSTPSNPSASASSTSRSSSLASSVDVSDRKEGRKAIDLSGQLDQHGTQLVSEDDSAMMMMDRCGFVQNRNARVVKGREGMDSVGEEGRKD
ncbi:Nn.00g071830.m01.CDS01 [Neocucurbitaria sp. VM-36]